MPSGAHHALEALRVCLRVLAAALVVATLVLVIPAPALRQLQIEVSLALQALEPEALRGLLVVATPAGTALRGDFLLSAAALLLVDWVVGRAPRIS